LPDFSTRQRRALRPGGQALAWSGQFDDTGAGLPEQNTQQLIKEAVNMKNPLDSLWGTVIAGIVLTAVLFVFARNFLG
jgi:hypothetical protein